MVSQLTERFSEAFDENLWRDAESVSGPGSTLNYTNELRSTLPALVRALGCASMVDAPCGDFNWMQAVDLTGIEYTGIDIVPALIEKLQIEHPHHRFQVRDITNQPLPYADVTLCRDVLFHLSNNDIVKVLANFVNSGSQWLATSHSFHVELMHEVPSGPTTFRPVNLTKAPFHLPYPDYVLKDYVPGFQPRWLGIWRRESIQSRFSA